MEYRSLGRTGVPVSVLCLGCMNFGGATPEAESMDLIDQAIDRGINFLDTANVYTKSQSETIVGKALKRNSKRESIVLATKVHRRMDDHNILSAGNNRRHILEECEASLRRLQTDYIDLYQIHRPVSDIPIDETLRALDDLVRAGKVRYIGLSSFPAWRVLESLWVSKELGLNRVISQQVPYHLLDRGVERELIPMAQTYGLAILSWSPLARGFLTGKYKRGQEIPSGSRMERDLATGRFPARARQHLTDQAYAVMDVVEALAVEKNCTPSQIALAWLMHQPGMTSVIVGPRISAHLKDNLGVLDILMAADDRNRLDEVAQPEQAIVSYYNGIDYDFKASKFPWI